MLSFRACRYFLRPKSELQKALQETHTAAGHQQAELAKNKEMLIKDVQAVENEIRELIRAEPKLAERFLEG